MPTLPNQSDNCSVQDLIEVARKSFFFSGLSGYLPIHPLTYIRAKHARAALEQKRLADEEAAAKAAEVVNMSAEHEAPPVSMHASAVDAEHADPIELSTVPKSSQSDPAKPGAV
jgi:hypothetical protein